MTTDKQNALLLIGAVALLASACIGLVGRMYRTDLPWPYTTLKVSLYQAPTYQMATVHVATNRDSWVTASILRKIQLERDYGQAEWNELMDYHQADVGDQLNMIIDAAHIDAYDVFGINKELYPPFEVDAVKHNCPGHSSCQLGEAFK